MARARKVISRILLGLLLLALVLAAGLWLLVDTGALQQQLVAQVKAKTGRDLTIPGKLRLTLFPSLGLETGKVTLANAPGFGTRPMLEVRHLALGVKLLPLLHGQLVAETVVLDGLRLRLVRDRSGRTNWDDLITTPGPAKSKKAAPTAGGSTSPSAAGPALLAIAGVEIRDARLDWQDALTGQELHLAPVDLRVGQVKPDQPFPVTARIGFATYAPQMQGSVSAAASVTLRPARKRLELADLRIRPVLRGRDLPGGRVQGALSSDAVRLDLAADRLESPAIDWQGLGLAATLADLRITGLRTKPAWEAKLRVPNFSPRKLLTTLDVPLPTMADPKTLQRLTLDARLSGNLQRAAIRELRLALDDSRLKGEVSLPRLSPPAIRFQLKIDDIDADRYLPPPPPKGKAPPPTPAAAATAGVAAQGGPSLAPLRDLDLAGELTIDKLKIMNLHSQAIHIPVKAHQGRLQLAPLSARLYGGTYAGDIRLDVTGPDPHLQLDERLKTVRIGPLLKDYLGDDKLRGTADLAATLAADGLDPLAFRRTLNGHVRFDFRDGSVKGIDIPRMERELRARLKGQAPPPANPAQETAFSRITGSAKIVNGLARNEDLRAALPHARAIGKGVVDLVGERIDYTLLVKFTSEVRGQEGQPYEKIDKPPLPVHIRGPFERPAIQPDFEALLKALAKREVERKKRELENRARKELEKKGLELLKGLGLP